MPEGDPLGYMPLAQELDRQQQDPLAAFLGGQQGPQLPPSILEMLIGGLETEPPIDPRVGLAVGVRPTRRKDSLSERF